MENLETQVSDTQIDPAVCLGMTLTGVYRDTTKAAIPWTAIWRTPGGNAIHQRLDCDNDADKAEATDWAIANEPVWQPPPRLVPLRDALAQLDEVPA